MATDTFASAPWQTRPVFISSTFRDMQAERDYLRHVVFPRLEEELRKGRLLLEPIDLRQGVETAELENEEKRELLVLKVCLDEIQRSRPFLIVLLGDRYGWVPPEERMAAATQEAGFDADVRDKSVTALEIEFGIRKQGPEQGRRSFFYFRDPLPYLEMPENIRADFSDQFSADERTRVRHHRLAALKRSLAEDPELAPRVETYRASWDASKNQVVGLEAWGEQVYRHLLGELQAELSAAASQPPQTWEDQERAVLAEFIEQRRRDFTGREPLLDQLTNLAQSPVPPGSLFAITSGVPWGACVTGEAGSGKSAIFAELCSRLRADESILLLANAAGATPRGSQVEAMLKRFIVEMAAALGIANPLPENATPDDVDATFASLLGRVAARRRVVILLDALDQFDATTRALHLTWLRPNQWPANARIIATGIAGDPTEALSQWAGIEEQDVPPLTIGDDDSDDVTAIATSVWRRYHRQVNPAVLRVLKEKRLPDGSFAAGNPLWLTLALEQINLLDADDFARSERDFIGSATERLRAMLVDTATQMPPTVAELYDWLLAQTERFFGGANTQAFAATIAVSRSGWRESDLLALIPVVAAALHPDKPVQELDDLRLASLRRGFRAHVIRRGVLQQLDFLHSQMRQAIESRVLRATHQVQVLHRAIADHLQSLPDADPLRTSELMYHLIAGNEPLRAARLYGDVDGPAATIVAATKALTETVIAGMTTQPNPNLIWLASLLEQPGLTRAELGMLARRMADDLYASLSDASDLSTQKSFLTPLIAWLRKMVDEVPTEAELFTMAQTLRQRGVIGLKQGDLVEARQQFLESTKFLRMFIEHDPHNIVWLGELATTLGWTGDVARSQGDLAGARDYYGESLRLRQQRVEITQNDSSWFEDRGMTDDRARQTSRLRNITGSTSEHVDLLAYYQYELMHEVSVSWELLGDLEQQAEDTAEATRMFTQSLAIRMQIANGWKANKAWERNRFVILGKLGVLCRHRNELHEAERLLNECRTGIEELVQGDPVNSPWRRDLAAAYGEHGDLCVELGKLDEAESLFQRAQLIFRALAESDPTDTQWQRDLAVSFEKRSLIARERSDFGIARDSLNDSLEIRRRLTELDPTNADWWIELARLCDQLCRLCESQSDFLEARRALLEECAIWRQLAAANSSHEALQRMLVECWNRLGHLAIQLGNRAEAQDHFNEGGVVAQRLAALDPRDPARQCGFAGFHYRMSLNAREMGDRLMQKQHLQVCMNVFSDLDAKRIPLDAAMCDFRRLCQIQVMLLRSESED